MIIGLTGAAGAGKDTTAQILVDEYGFTRVSFADSLRQIALTIDPIIEYRHVGSSWELQGWEEIRLNEIISHIGWDKAKRDIPEARRLLQVIGTEVGRDILGENVWVEIAAKKMQALGDYVITDCRFPNEVDFIRNQKGVVVKIVRPNNPFEIPKTHASEQLEVEPDYTLTNDGDIDSLINNVKVLQQLIIEDAAIEMGG